jgi:hypothetical protein
MVSRLLWRQRLIPLAGRRLAQRADHHDDPQP